LRLAAHLIKKTTSAAASQNISVTLPMFNPDVPMPQRGVKPRI